ncbi:unnamed protein product [Sphenostylis stenocarpa]|uniref:HMA domain-containing protein n=1 Tax=Sphenostylis stenocarpa TaxID=92480 RepID=A0AA86VKD4_9FABA|nr:unnamed protein product [Sphenostylis stenocarpa]
MKQKIVIRVSLDCDKCRTKALKIAAEAKGVSSVALEGDYKDKVAVTGIMVDSVRLVKTLRKKFGRGNANIVSVEELKDKKKEEEKIAPVIWSSYPYPPPYPPTLAHEHEYGNFCILM